MDNRVARKNEPGYRRYGNVIRKEYVSVFVYKKHPETKGEQ